MATARYVIALLLVIGIPPAVVWWILIHPFVGLWRRVGVAASLWINGVLLAAGWVALWVFREPLVGRDLGGSVTTAVAGALFLSVSIWIAIKRRRQLTFRILSGAPELQADGKGGTLLTEGPYAIVRHPRYVEVMVGCLGYALLANYTGGYLITALTAPLLHLVVLMEERELRARFGDAYRAYAERVPRYVPRGLSGAPRR